VGATGIRLLSVFGVDRLPLGALVTFNGRLALASLLLSIVIAIAMAVPVAWFSLRNFPAVSLRAESRGDTANFAAQRLRQCLIAVQIALAFVLLTGAGLLGLSLKRTMEVLPGVRVDNTLAGRISLPSASYRDDKARLAFTDRLLEQVQAQPGVTAAGVITDVPVNGVHEYNAMTIVGRAVESGVPPTLHNKYGVMGNYFKAMGIPLREGRFLESSDSRVEMRSCVVDEDFAKLYWPQGGAVGQRIFEGPPQGRQPSEAFTVVGVVGKVKQGELTDNKANGAIYFPYRYNANDSIFVVLSTGQTPDSLGLALRSVVRGIDPDLPIDDLRSMKVRVADSLIARRSPALLAGVFSIVALLLAAVGTYGVLSYAVAQRRREIAVRMALGARRRQVMGQFLRLGAKSLAGGLCAGGFGAWAMSRVMKSVLFKTAVLDATVLTAAAATMVLVVMIAVFLPSRRAARIEPMEALKCE
jgi:predicted permease